MVNTSRDATGGVLSQEVFSLPMKEPPDQATEYECINETGFCREYTEAKRRFVEKIVLNTHDSNNNVT